MIFLLVNMITTCNNSSMIKDNGKTEIPNR